MRILMLAHDCNPDWPSLPVVGYNTCRALGLQNEVKIMLVTHIRNKQNIESKIIKNIDIEYIDNEVIARPIYKLSKRLRGGESVAWTLNVALQYPSYIDFERRVWRRFGSRLRSGSFDIVHRLTPMSPTLPSPLSARLPVPFVIGPLNGGLRWPRGYQSEKSREREWLTHVRDAHRLLPYYGSTYRRAAAILAAFDHTIQDLPRHAINAGKVVWFPEVGVDPRLFPSRDSSSRSSQLDFVYVGRLVPYKCPDVAVEAFVRSPLLRQHRLTVVGEGPERAQLEAIIQRYDAHDRVTLVGKLTQSEVGRIMRNAHVLVFPSIRELGAGVVVEAMACGLACIVVDYGAPGALVGQDRGLAVPLAPKPELTLSVQHALEQLARDPALIDNLGRAAQTHALEFYSWDAKASKIVEVYEWVLGLRGEKPSFLDQAATPH